MSAGIWLVTPAPTPGLGYAHLTIDVNNAEKAAGCQ